MLYLSVPGKLSLYLDHCQVIGKAIFRILRNFTYNAPHFITEKGMFKAVKPL